MRNDPQTVLKSIKPLEEISINISKKLNGKEVDDTLKAVAAFTNTFGADDQYEITVKVTKIIENEESQVSKNGEVK